MAKILVVDDSTIMRRNLMIMLKRAGHTIVGESKTGSQAYRDYKEHLPDIVTMDITMPTMNGIDAIKSIIGEYPNAKIIVISALDQKHTIFDALQFGAKNYLLKPVLEEKLVSVIDDILMV